MSKKISRRAFMTSAFYGTGAIAFSREVTPFIHPANAKSYISSEKKLLATTDYYDNMIGCQCFFERSHLDDLHKYLASIGVTRHQWIVDTIWNYYETHPHGIDLLAEAADSAHSHGIEFYAKIKPFEGGGFGDALPHSLPFKKNVSALRDMRGIYPIARPFAAKNPHFSLKRKPGTYEVSGPVSTIRLVKGDDTPTRIRQKDLNIWTSDKNNGFTRYHGPVSFRESVEWRPGFPRSKKCHIIHLEGLEIPDGHNYILVRCLLTGDNSDFSNERGNIAELEDINGNIIPFILGAGPVDYNVHREIYEHRFHEDICRYFQLPEVRAEFKDRRKAAKHYEDFYNFDIRRPVTEPYTLDRTGYIAIACGKPEYMPGILNPIYPEVREHWLDMVRFCLDRGVDGINFRIATHTQSPEYWEYGYNEPVIEAACGKNDYITIKRINGDAYTKFLREARELIKGRGKSITIQLYAQMLMPDDRHGLNWIPPNFEWQWEKFIREIADDLEFRGAWTLRPWNLHQVIDAISSVIRDSNKPFYYEGNRVELGRAGFNGPFHSTREEINMVNNNPDLDGLSLYETEHFTRMNKDQRIEGSPDLADLLRNKFFKQY